MRDLQKDFSVIMNNRKADKVPKTFRLPDTLVDDLKETSEKLGLTETEIVMCALTYYLGEE